MKLGKKKLLLKYFRLSRLVKFDHMVRLGKVKMKITFFIYLFFFIRSDIGQSATLLLL